MKNPCIIPGCKKEGIWVLGVRARLTSAGVGKTRISNKGATSAAWAPDVPAWLCDTHVAKGLLITVLVEPRKYRATRVRALGASEDAPHRTVKIRW